MQVENWQHRLLQNRYDHLKKKTRSWERGLSKEVRTVWFFGIGYVLVFLRICIAAFALITDVKLARKRSRLEPNR